VYYLSEGLKIYALLTIPNGEKPEGGFPAIVFNHGYIPPDVYKTTERYIHYVDQLARSGYVVFRIDYRGHDQSEGEATGAYGNPGYQIDVMNAVASLKQHPYVNPEKIGMWGHSMGGYLTLRAMVISDDVKVGVIWAGVVASYTDLLYNWRRTGAFTPSPSSTGRGWRGAWIQEYGTPEQNPEFWDSVSATSYLADLSGPLELHHGTADDDVPVEFSIRLAELGRQYGQIVNLYTYEGDNHNISKYFTQAMNQTIAFYDIYLK
jgi:dipeptidyl aminopeptidase/acylaminoacyl peptidase